jgi:hypothetical protein
MEKIVFALICAVMIALTAYSAASIEITEIMYNPTGDDNYYEYLEIHSDAQSSLQGYYFYGIDLTFNNTDIEGYFVVCKNKEKFKEMYNETCDETYKGSLLNTGETIILYDNLNQTVDQITYTNTANEGLSITKENAWQPTLPNPKKRFLLPGDNSSDTNSTINDTNTDFNETNPDDNDTTITDETNITIFNETNPINTTKETIYSNL